MDSQIKDETQQQQQTTNTLLSNKPRIKYLLLDINGVLFNSGIDSAIDGSVEAMRKLAANNVDFCLVTNECTLAKRKLAAKLNSLGFESVTAEKMVSPAPVAAQYIKEHQLVPHFHVYESVMDDFNVDVNVAMAAAADKNCLVVGDLMDKLSRDVVDASLETMLECRARGEEPALVALGTGRYYRDGDCLRMDTGAFVAAFEYALGVKALNFGKPAPKMFELAMRTLNGASVDNTLMIGDDIESDVAAAQAFGLRAALVRTGKYKPSDERHKSGARADAVFDDLRQAVDFILADSQPNK